MYIVRETFTAKPGMASKLAALFKSVVPAEAPDFKVRVMTDYIAAFNTVVLETEVEDLGQFETIMAHYMSSSDVRERMKGYTDMYLAGRREVFKTL